MLAADKTTDLIPPYGGKLVDLLIPPNRVNERLAYASTLPTVHLSARATCDLEMLAVGAFSPLDRFMGQADYQSVLDTMRLTNGAIFSIPIVLAVNPGEHIAAGRQVVLRDESNDALAIMHIEEVYPWDVQEFAVKVAGKYDVRHPLVAEMNRWAKLFISGPLEVIQLPKHYDFKDLRFTPAQTRAMLQQMGHANVVAFQTRNPLHRVHEELTKRAVQAVDGALLLHPVVGMTKPGDVDHYTRVRTYKALTSHYYDPDRVLLSLLPMAMRMAGPREALWHAVIRRNYGANHLIVGRDHAGPGNDSQGKPFYGPYDAQELVVQYESELGVTMVPFSMLVYLPEEDRYEEEDKITPEAKIASISGTQVREDYLQKGRKLPEWFTRPEVAEILGETYPPRYRQGACIWFTGLSGSGKSTNANVLTTLLLEHGRQVTVLDGNVVRTHFSEDLGYSREDRARNMLRMGYVASEIVRHGGLVIVSSISPYRAERNEVRNMIGKEHYVEVFVDTPLEICEIRDNEGLYARARRGEIKGFTGIDDPYEKPLNPELAIDTVRNSAEINARLVLDYLIKHGFVREEELAANGNGANVR